MTYKLFIYSIMKTFKGPKGDWFYDVISSVPCMNHCDWLMSTQFRALALTTLYYYNALRMEANRYFLLYCLDYRIYKPGCFPSSGTLS